ncbi:MAG: FAD-binding oxidoreductase [Halieaceae bacterium]|jgi:FAD/FMN-containing dehydrogenase|nr:FAD-binding oxidoreductase [Halieaceae bacterium]
MRRPTGRGVIHERGTPGFDKTVLATSFNGRDPGHRPRVLVEANDVSDVVEALKRARRENLKVSIFSGGHSWAQNHLREGALLLSMARLNSIEIDPESETATAGPGCWGVDLDRALRKHGLFFPVAHAPDVCLGGFLLQGGFGWGGTRVGLAIQSVIGLDVVLADGNVVHASDKENPDLYWAARGAGPGFFGVVVRYHLRLHKRHKASGMKIQVFSQKHLEDVYTWADKVGPEVSNLVEFQLLITPKAMGTFGPGIEVFAPVLASSWKEAREAVAFLSNSPIRSKASLTTPLIPASISFMSLIANFTHFPANAKWCTDNMWVDAPIEQLLPGLRKIGDTMPPAPSHSLLLYWNPHNQPERPDMAFSLEAGKYLAVYGEWKKDADEARYANWATERMQEMAPLSLGVQLADENLGRRPARFTKDTNLARLDQLRSTFDPQGLFNSYMGRLG